MRWTRYILKTVGYIRDTGSVRALGGVLIGTRGSSGTFNRIRDATSIPAGIESFLTNLQNAFYHVLYT